MELNEYQKKAAVTSTYEDDTLGISARFLGLSGEAGEATDKAKKEIRDHIDTAFNDEARNAAIASELGDALWYLSQCAAAIGWTLDDVAILNIKKLQDRARRNKIHGSGDNR